MVAVCGGGVSISNTWDLTSCLSFDRSIHASKHVAVQEAD